MTEFERVSIGLSILTLCITATAIGVAAEQLNSWRKELTGSERYRVAMRLHASLLKLELAISQARAVATFGSSAPNSQQDDDARIKYDIERRWSLVYEALGDLKQLQIEARVYLSSTIDGRIDALLDRVWDLRLALHKYLDLQTGRVTSLPDASFQELFAKVYGTGKENDVFAQEIRKCISEIEEDLSQYTLSSRFST